MATRPTIQQILLASFPLVDATVRLPNYVRRCARRLMKCRTAALGGHVQACPRGHIERVWYNSCRHRSCPQCALLQVERWLGKQRLRMLPCRHHHIVFTVPTELYPLWLANKREMAQILFTVVRDSLFKLLDDPVYLGARPGIIASLHTWGQQLQLHPHIHALVTAGGLSESGQWQRETKAILLPRQVLMRVYRGKLRAALMAALDRGVLRLPPETREAKLRGLFNKLGRLTLNVKLLPHYSSGRGVLTYLARYLRGGPIRNTRLVAFGPEQVRFRYHDYRDGRRKQMSLSPEQFIRRFLLHVPPARMQMVRSFGLYASRKAYDLDRCHQLLGIPRAMPGRDISWQALLDRLGYARETECRVCGEPLVRQRIIPAARPPPVFQSARAA